MVGGRVPAAYVAGDAAGAGARGEVGGRPDVVEAAALVGGLPVGGAVGPPGVEAALGEVGAGDVDPAAGRLRGGEGLDLDGGVGDDPEELLVAPDVVLARGDVEVADEDGALGGRVGGPGAELGEEVELVGELRVERRVGEVAAGGDVEVVDDGAGRKAGGDVAGVAAGAEVAVREGLERQAGEDGDAVVGLLAADGDVGVAEGAEAIEGELLDRGLGLLEAEDVRAPPRAGSGGRPARGGGPS